MSTSADAWIRLDLAGVHTPEAYTIPLTAVALVFGLLRHRRSPAISSWPVFGPALAVTLLPQPGRVVGRPRLGAGPAARRRGPGPRRSPNRRT
ncbi:MAG TPA: hypothetical protein VNW94_15655 [Streptosporangiaceae bacterium]|nr:hypothetical protein [Streptosporangiaceae bacterium]